jgi:glycine C-acetyltransferase/8-amino-7-oxononanoate synthase
VPDGVTQIVPVIVGDAGEAVRASERALEQGVFAQAIRPPTVPAGSSRLRLTVMASHTRSELRDAARLLAKCVTVTMRESDAMRAAPAASETEADREAAPARVFDGLRDAA